MMAKKSGILVSLLLFSVYLSAQVWEMTDATVNTCGGIFIDDDGGTIDGTNGGADYSDNSYTFTICPDNPDDGIRVTFTAFSISNSNINPDNNDILLVFNGDAPSGPLLQGNSNDINFTGLSFSATADNPTGCLTFQFIRNPSNDVAAGWQATIECVTPCTTPVSSGQISEPVMDADNSVQVCIGQEVQFEDVGSNAGNGFTLENYIWDFGDGTVSTDSPSVSHSYTEPGEYIITYIVEDNNGCQSTNITPFQVLVSTIPIFNTEFDSPVCQGGVGEININPLQNVTWTALPPQVFAEEQNLADGVGFEYENSLIFNFFDEDQTLDDCNDLLGINTNLEHSYIGDLDVSITCPDGTTVNLLEYPNGGGGGWLGEPIDNVPVDEPGVGYDYVWTPQADNGTWGENALGGQPLPSGVYESEQDMCNLVGCPLNGEWTMTFVDNLASDDGNIFSWGIDFNPDLFPGVTTFTPIVGLGSDSSFVTGPNIISSSPDGNFVSFETTDIGTLEYTVSAINNFGCQTDTTLVVEVVDVPQITLDESVTGTACEFFQLEPEIVSEANAGEFELTMSTTNVEGNFFFADLTVTINGVFYQTFSQFGDQNYTIPVENGDEVEIEYNGGTNGDQITLTDEFGNVLFESPVSPQNGQIYEGVVFNGLQVAWTPEFGLDSPSQINVSGEFQGNTTYSLTVFPVGFEECAVSESIDVITEEIPNIGESTVAEFCTAEIQEEFNLIDVLNGNPDPVGEWQDADGNVIDEIFDPEEDEEGLYYHVLSLGDCDLSAELEIVIHDLAIQQQNDVTICQNGTATLEALLQGDNFNDVTVSWNSGAFEGEMITVQPQVALTSYTAVASYFNDICQTEPMTVNVELLNPLAMSPISDEVICLGDEIELSILNSSGGLEPYEFSWSSEGVDIAVADSVIVSPSLTTEYCVEMTDNCESSPVEQCFNVQLNEVISTMFTVENSSGCAPINAQFSGSASDLSLIQSVVWDFGDGTTSNAINQTNHTYEDPGIYDVLLVITGIDGCVYSSFQENAINVFQVPTAEFRPVSEIVVLPDNEFSFNNLSTFNDVNVWTFDEYGTSTEINPDFTAPSEEPDQYEIELAVFTSNGCTDTVKYTVFLNNGFSLFAPTAFTPDNDGINEFWSVTGIDIDTNDYELVILNRNGEVVFSTRDLFAVWDGSHLNGDHYVPNGVYNYLITTREKTTGDKREIKGHITVLR